MRIKFFHLITRLLLLAFLTGVFPIQSLLLHAQTEEQDQKKKKKRKKKSSKKKKSSSKKKKKSSSKKKKKRPSKKKKRSKKKQSSKKKKSVAKSKRSAPIKVSATPVPKKEVSIVQLTGELFNYTNKLNTSRDRLARATRYLASPQKKEVVRIESRAKF